MLTTELFNKNYLFDLLAISSFSKVYMKIPAMEDYKIKLHKLLVASFIVLFFCANAAEASGMYVTNIKD